MVRRYPFYELYLLCYCCVHSLPFLDVHDGHVSFEYVLEHEVDPISWYFEVYGDVMLFTLVGDVEHYEDELNAYLNVHYLLSPRLALPYDIWEDVFVPKLRNRLCLLHDRYDWFLSRLKFTWNFSLFVGYVFQKFIG